MKSKQRNVLAVDAQMAASALCVETQQGDRRARYDIRRQTLG